MKPPQRTPTRRNTLPVAPRNQEAQGRVTFGKFKSNTGRGHKTILYGTGGIGKSTLACLAPGPVAYLDTDDSIDILIPQLEEIGIDIPARIDSINWDTLRTSLQASNGWDDVKTIVLDHGSTIEEWAVQSTLAGTPLDNGNRARSIESYGFGKGYQFVYETFKHLLTDLDRHARAGRNIILICHDCTADVPNPDGNDFLRYEPRMQSPKSGKGSIRHLLKEWCDHMLFYQYDKIEQKDDKNKMKGSGSRSIVTAETPACMAKSRTCADKKRIFIDHGVSPWDLIIK